MTRTMLMLIHKQTPKHFHSSSLIAQYLITYLQGTYFVTLVTWSCFLRAVTWAAWICTNRRDRCWQLLMSDCKLLIRRAADLWLKFRASKSHLEEEIRYPGLYLFFFLNHEYKFGHCVLVWLLWDKWKRNEFLELEYKILEEWLSTWCVNYCFKLIGLW